MNILMQLHTIMSAFKNCGNEPEKIVMSPTAFHLLEDISMPTMRTPIYEKTIPTFCGVEIEIDENLKDCRFYIK